METYVLYVNRVKLYRVKSGVFNKETESRLVTDL